MDTYKLKFFLKWRLILKKSLNCSKPLLRKGWTFFSCKIQNAATIFRFILLVCAGILAVFGSKVAGLTGGGALAALITPMVAVRGWKSSGYGHSIAQISTALRYCWVICQPLLFGLIGAAVDFSTLEAKRVGRKAIIFIVIIISIKRGSMQQHTIWWLMLYKQTFLWEPSLWDCMVSWTWQ